MGTPLGDFIRARRDATSPESVGLRAGARRRAPGLRRAELATLAGVSVEYLVRIEQGRDRNPSVAVVNALADAMRLDVPEREHLRKLAMITGGECRGDFAPPGTDVRPPVREILHQFEPGIAMITNRLGDVLAHTSGFALLARSCGLLDADRPNLTRFVFADRRAREVFPDWDRVADERAFDLWLGPTRDQATRFADELTALAGAEFARRRNRHAVPPVGVLRWRHPDAGELQLEREVMELPPADAQQLVVFLPADDASAERLAALRHTPLRAVN